MNDKIIIKGAKENNLKNIDLEIPKNKIVVVTGPSGSGKSTLAFDTIYAEGKRRYIESLSSYARQFLGGSEKADVDSIEGLSPAISIDQKTGSNNPRSTVGTITEIYDYLRLLYARIGVPKCPNHQIEIKALSAKQITDNILEKHLDKKAQIIARVVNKAKGTHVKTLQSLLEDGYFRVIINGQNYDLSDEIDTIKLEKNKKHQIDIIIDRLVINMDESARILSSIETAIYYGNGEVRLLIDQKEVVFSANFSCPICGFTVPELEPKLFSFNAPFGSCVPCGGLGNLKEPDIDIIVPNKNLSLQEGAITVSGFNAIDKSYYFVMLEAVCDQIGIRMDIPFKKLTDEEVQIILYGYDSPLDLSYKSTKMEFSKSFIYEGVANNIKRRYLETTSHRMRRSLEGLMRHHVCSTCQGKRLNDKALAIEINNLNIHDLTELSIKDGLVFLENLTLSANQQKIADMVLEEVISRYLFLKNVGLSYLNLSRSATTLSGGEAQRIRLATQIGSKLTGVLYVLDEPSIGLHQRDNDRLINTLKEMRDLGNTLIVVEHDDATMREADHIIDIGPGSGIYGGEVVAQGTIKQIMNNKKSLTGQYLSKKKQIEIPEKRRKQTNGFIEIKGAKANNLQNVNVKIPLDNFVCITGVSGSGKSTLINQVLYKNIYNHFNPDAKVRAGECKEVKGLDQIKKVIEINQKPIGRTPRSNPATYVGVFDDIRDLFASLQESKALGYNKGRFSFNVKGGRCEECQGDGIIKIEMNFLPDVYVTCEKCNGKRYNDEVLSVKYRGNNISDILEMSIDQAHAFFINIPNITRKMQTLVEVGLGYLKVGTQATVLSGGEAQRIKLSKELQKVTKGETFYILDEPTTGLHVDDIKRLIKVLQRLVDNGNTVLVIEHNLDLIKISDYIIDLGPEGGDEGGIVIAQTTPEKLVEVKESYTGYYLKDYLKN